MRQPSLLRRFFSGIWRIITRVRLALSNILFLAMIAFIYFIYVGGAPEPLPDKAALLLNISGTVVDQKSDVNPLQALLGAPSRDDHEVLLRDVIEAIDYAAQDSSINALVMELDSLGRLGISKTQEIVDALGTFRKSGKPIVAVGTYYTQGQYLLASHADTVIAHPLGGVALEGYSSYHNYFREALKKISVNVHVFRAGDHKSAVEPFMRDDMSPAEKELTSRWLNNLWEQYTATVETQRELKPGMVDHYVNNFAQLLQDQGGDAAQTALQSGLVDKLLTRSQGNDFLVELVGASDDDGLYEAVVFEHYVARKRPLSLGSSDSDRVAVITAEGTILPGEQPPGSIGGASLARLIRGAVEAEGVKAIVLRINSGGGSMFASEIIREQVVYARNMGLPVVASMGAVAASGGYYIAADADEIWATPSTITGSIGVFAAFPTFEELLQRVGIYTDGVGTTDLAGSMRADRPLNPQLEAALTSGVAFAYKSFVQIVAEGRDMSVAEVDPLAEGRVWSAPDALKAGLVDSLGSLDDAIAAAAARAGLESYEVQYVEIPMSARDRLMKQLANSVGSLQVLTQSAASSALSDLLGPMQEAAKELGSMQDPGYLYMRCVSCSMAR
jgi:protease-4